MNKYMTDEELEKFILDIEEHEIVKAPPQLLDNVFEEIDNRNKIVEYRKFRNRVIVSVAAILVITAFAPSWTKLMRENVYSSSETISDLSKSYYISNFFNGNEE